MKHNWRLVYVAPRMYDSQNIQMPHRYTKIDTEGIVMSDATLTWQTPYLRTVAVSSHPALVCDSGIIAVASQISFLTYSQLGPLPHEAFVFWVQQ